MLFCGSRESLIRYTVRFFVRLNPVSQNQSQPFSKVDLSVYTRVRCWNDEKWDKGKCAATAVDIVGVFLFFFFME